SDQTRPSERETAVAAGNSYCCGNQNPLGRVKDSRENSRVHCSIDWHSAKRTVRSQVGRYQSLCRNNERGAIHRSWFRRTVQNGIFSEARAYPPLSLRSTGQMERTVPLSLAGR